MKKLFLLVCLLLLPCVVYAAGKISYNIALGHVNNYIYNYADYEKYLVTSTHKFSFGGSTIGEKNNFVNAGYLNLDEYLIAGSVNSYLYDGQDYYTMTDDISDGNKIYIVSHTKLQGYDSISKSDSSTYTGNRVTEFIAKTTKLNGNGTYQNPWTFGVSDVEGPVITFDPNGDSTWLKTRSVTVIITDEASNVKKAQTLKYRWQTSSTCSTSMADYSLTSTLSNASADSKTATATISDSTLTGQFYLCVAAGIEDTSGNVSSYAGSAGTYYFNNTRPVVDGINTLITGNDVLMAIDSHYSLPIDKYYYGYSTTSNCNPTNLQATNSYTYTLADGSYYVCVKLGDVSGNESDVFSKQITVSNVITYAQLIADYSCANGSAGTAPYIMTYSGNCSIVNDSGTNWKVILSSTGTKTITFNRATNLNVFLVGGGGGGGTKYSWRAGGGGGGGRTNTGNYSAIANTPYNVTVGTAGAAAASGVASSGFGLSAAGGSAGNNASSTNAGTGGAGGSGGGGGGNNQAKTNGGTGGNGGSYGNAGGPNNRDGTVVPGGAGQGFTTCEFGTGSLSGCNNGVTYSGGGPGGAGQSSNGVGAIGAYGSCTSTYGCGGRGQGTTAGATAGSQGVVIIRNAR